MQKRKIISDMMLFVCGMIAGRIIFQGINIISVILIGIGGFTILWMVWDNMTEKEGRRKREKDRKAA